MAGLVTIKRYYDLPEALAAKALLESHGLMPFLPDEYFIAASWMHLFALGGFRLQVVEAEAAQAHELLSGEDRVMLGEGVETCPECGSGNVFRAKSLIAGLAIVIASAVPFLIGTRRRYCRNCGARWRVGSEAPERDPSKEEE